MKYFIIILVPVTLYLAYSYYNFNSLIRKSKILSSNTTPYEYFNLENTKSMLIVGDSTSYGVGASDKNESLIGLISGDHRDYNITNKSVSGLRTHQLINILREIDESYDVVVISIGSNDVTRYTNLFLLREDLNQVFIESKRVGQKVIVTLPGSIGSSRILPRPITLTWEIYFDKMREVFIRASKDSNVIYTEYYIEKSIDPFYTKQVEYHADDSFHPSSIGYKAWYYEIKDDLGKVL